MCTLYMDFQKKIPKGRTSQKMRSVASKMAEVWPWTFLAIGLEKLTLAFPFKSTLINQAKAPHLELQ